MSGLRDDWEDSEDTVATPDALDALLQAADGLLMPSESDYPFTAFRWPGPDPLTPAALLAQEGMPPDTPVEERAFSTFFARLTTAQDWHSDDYNGSRNSDTQPDKRKVGCLDQKGLQFSVHLSGRAGTA